MPSPIPPVIAEEPRTWLTPHAPNSGRCRLASGKNSSFKGDSRGRHRGKTFPKLAQDRKTEALKLASMKEWNSSGSAEPGWTSGTPGRIPSDVPDPFVAGAGDVDDRETAEHRWLAEIDGLGGTENHTRVALTGRRIAWRIRRIRRIRRFLSVALAVMSVATHVGGPNGVSSDLSGVLNASVVTSMGEEEVSRPGQNHGQHGNAEAQPRHAAGEP